MAIEECNPNFFSSLYFEALLPLWFLASKLHFFILNHLLHIPDAHEQMSSDDESEEMELDLSSPGVVTKYKNAAEIINSH